MQADEADSAGAGEALEGDVYYLKGACSCIFTVHDM